MPVAGSIVPIWVARREVVHRQISDRDDLAGRREIERAALVEEILLVAEHHIGEERESARGRVHAVQGGGVGVVAAWRGDRVAGAVVVHVQPGHLEDPGFDQGVSGRSRIRLRVRAALEIDHVDLLPVRQRRRRCGRGNEEGREGDCRDAGERRRGRGARMKAPKS